MSDSYRYKAFICYSHVDRDWAAWLHRSLERYRVPKHLRGWTGSDRIHPVFRDSEELPTSSDLSSAIREALRQSEFLIVLCSSHAAESRWVNEEIRLFKGLGRQDRIHSVIVDGHKDARIESLVPAELRSRGDDSVEPLAADARPHADGRDQARIKLLAGVLGVSVDALRNRELQRRQRRWVGISAALAAVLLVTGSLAILALVSREQALVAEQRASKEAETAQQVADFLVEQFNLSDPGVIRGNTITAREILERSSLRLEHLAGQPLVRARLMQTIGDAYTKLGLYTEANPLLVQSLDIRREQFGSDHAEVAASLNALGELSFEEGKFIEAEALFMRALEIRERVLGPEDPDLATTLNNLGILFSHGIEGKGDEAEVMFQRALEIRERALPPHHPDVLESQALLASRYEHDGRFDDAIPLYERALVNYEQALGPDHPEVAWTLNALANIHSRRGSYEDAERLFRRAMEIREKVFGPDHPELAWTLREFAVHHLHLANYVEAERLFQRALAIRDARLDPNEPGSGVPWYLEGLDADYAALLRATHREDEAARVLMNRP